MKTIFITGTDTGVGKTYVATTLLKQLNAKGYKTFAIKPIASGCRTSDNDYLENEDALALQNSSSLFQPYSVVNPIALKEPIAPHIAAKKMGLRLAKHEILTKITLSLHREADINLIEGAGGWALPLNDHELFSEVISSLNIPVILVVGIKLGCLNHAILTYQNIIQMKVKLIGWVANCLEPNALAVDENIQTLQQWIPQPCLGVLPFDIYAKHNLTIEFIERFFEFNS